MKVKFALFLVLGLLCIESIGQSTITLRRSFIDSFKNVVTIASEYDVWFTHHKANRPENDGDIHASGYDKIIGMPTVAEVMNAKDEQETIELFIAHEGKGKSNNVKLPITGVWRLWPEHMGSGSKFFQGMKLSQATIKKKTTNPDHVFEIHPITAVGDLDVTSSIHNIEGYTPKIALNAFNQIKAKKCVITSTKKTISFKTSAIGQNYIDMWIRIDSLWEVEDGAFAYCLVLDSDFNPDTDEVEDKKISNKQRIVFVKNSESFNTVMQKNIGDFIHILGTPRVNLAILSWREWVSKQRPEVLSWPLPIEIIAAGQIE